MSSLFKINQEISKLNRMNPDKVKYDYIKSCYGKLLDDIHTVIGATSGGEIFFRARKDSGFNAAHEEQFLAPPNELVTGFQRCNPPHKSTFYSASTRAAALLEIDVKVGDTVYLSQWMGNNKIPFNRIFDTTLEDSWRSKMDDRSQAVHTYLDTLFTRRIHKTFSNDYKFTSAISEQLMSKFPSHKDNLVSEDGFVALRYPSVADIERSYNTAMSAQFAKERLKLLHVSKIEILSIEDSSISVSIIDNAYKIFDGKIIWSNNPNAYPARRTNGVPFISEGGKWRILTISDSAPEFSVNDWLYE